MHKFARIFAVTALMLAGASWAQTVTLLDEVSTVAAAGAAVPVELSVDITTAGNYEVTLTDLGAPGAALASVRLAVTRGAEVIGTPLTATGTLSFAATADTRYVIRVTGTPGAAIGSGLIRVDVRNPATTTLINSFVAMLAPPPGEPAAGQFVLDNGFTVTSTGSYTVTLRDLLLPQVLPDLLLAVVEEGGSLVAALSSATGNPAAQTVTLTAGTRYRLFSIAVPATPSSGGLYSFEVVAAGGTTILSRTVPVGGAVFLASVNLPAGAHTLAVDDLAFPAPLGAVVVDVVKAGQIVAQAGSAIDVPFTATAGTHDIYAFGMATAGSIAGSLSVSVGPSGQPAVFSMARVFAAPGEASVFSYDTTIANAGNFRARLADYQFPAAFQTLRLAAVQNGALLGTPLTAPGSFDFAAVPGRVSLLAVARGNASGSLFGVDVSPTALGAVAFETTQGVGGTFVNRRVSLTSSMSLDVRVSDLAFPAAFGNLSTAVTRGSDRIGVIFGGGTFDFNATPGSYFVNLIATPGNNQNAGTYAVSVTDRPPPPVVTLNATPNGVSSGGAVDLTWSSQAATSCTATGGWTGSKAVSGTERSAALTTATTFTLACTGAGGTTSSNVTVNVQAAGASSGGGGGGSFDLLSLGMLVLLVVMLAGLRARRAAPVVAILVTTLALAGCGGAQSRYARSMERGSEFLDAGDLEKARVEFRNASQISPQSAEARYQSGVVAQRRGDFREALDSYKSAIDMQPDYPEAQAAMARIFLLAGATDRAMETVAPALVRHPDNARLLVVRGTGHAQMKRLPEARADAEKALQSDPAEESAVALMASLMRGANETEPAMALLEAAVQRLPDSLDLRRVLATLKIEAGDLAGAEVHLRETVRIRPKELALRYELANFFLRAGKTDEAQKTLESAVSAAPKSDEAKLVLADFLAAHRSPAEGEKKLRELIARDEDNLELRVGLGGLLERLDRDQQAIAAYEEIIKREPASPAAVTARNRMAAFHATHGNLPRAEELLAEVIKDNPRDTEALGLRARLAIDKGSASAAVVDLRTVLRDMPSSADAHRLLARAHVANDEPALAEEALRKALELEPTNAAARLELAQILIRSGRADAAVNMLEDAVRRNPTDAAAREALVRTYVETRDLVAAARNAEDLQVLLPKSPMGFYYRGRVAELQGAPALAARQYELALEQQPQALDVLAAAARLQIAAGRGGEAIARVDELLAKATPDQHYLRNLRGELLLATQQPELAAPEFEKVIGQLPKWWMPYRNLAIARYQLKDAEGAIRTYEAGIKAAPGEVALVVDLASLYELQKRIDDAVRVYEQYHALHPSLDLVSNNLARILLAHRNDEKSLARAATLTARFDRSGDPALLDTLGWALLRNGDIERAQQVLETAFARAPDSGSIRYHLALAQVEAGQLARAIDNLESAVKSSRGFVGLQEARALLADLKSRVG